mgnify:CR=1 FL=1
MTTSQAAALFGLAPVTVRRAARLGTLRAMRVGRDWLVTPEDVAAYVRDHSVPTRGSWAHREGE